MLFSNIKFQQGKTTSVAGSQHQINKQTNWFAHDTINDLWFALFVSDDGETIYASYPLKQNPTLVSQQVPGIEFFGANCPKNLKKYDQNTKNWIAHFTEKSLTEALGYFTNTLISNDEQKNYQNAKAMLSYICDKYCFSSTLKAGISGHKSHPMTFVNHNKHGIVLEHGAWHATDCLDIGFDVITEHHDDDFAVFYKPSIERMPEFQWFVDNPIPTETKFALEDDSIYDVDIPSFHVKTVKYNIIDVADTSEISAHEKVKHARKAQDLLKQYSNLS